MNTTALMMAVYDENVELASILMKCEGDVKDVDGETASQ